VICPKTPFGAEERGATLWRPELGAYCRQRGLYPAQVRAWRGACEQAND